MKTIWSEDSAEIRAELQKNNDDQVGMTLIGPSLAPIFITVKALVRDGNQFFVEFEKPEGVELEGELFAFYQRDDFNLMRGFKLGEMRQTNRFFRIPPPEHIFEVQRRKFPRVYAAEGSCMTCAPRASRRILHGEVIDVSLEGAKIFGKLIGVQEGTVLAPVTLTLFFDDRRTEEIVINIAEAVVVREIRVKEKVELSFHFQTEDADMLLNKYIELRILEQELYN